LWAKTYVTDRDAIGQLHRHMTDSAEVAAIIWREWLPMAIKKAVAEAAGGEESGETLVAWLGGLHDIGKATPGFQIKVERFAARVHEAGLPMPRSEPSPRLFHSTASHIIFEDALAEGAWSKTPNRARLAAVLGGHHGAPPDPAQVLHLMRSDRTVSGLGDGPWRQVQKELFDYVTAYSGASAFLDLWAGRTFPAAAVPLLTGVVIVADWIASNAELFPPNDLRESAERAEAAWAELGLPPPWRSVNGPGTAEDGLRTRFGFEPGCAARPVQRAALQIAHDMNGPGIMIVEAAMGAGKTEAALLAAEVLAAKAGSGGVGFMLPTQATSNAMFSRVHNWGEGMFRATGTVDAQSFFLAHGKAEFNDEFRSLIRWRESSMGDEDAAADLAVAHNWLMGRKKGLLADFVVGTVDQILMMALKARHLALRHLAFAGKVVVIDEAHAYDVYMNVYLDRALYWLGVYGTPVIVLSATLPSARRTELIAAYRQGLGVRRPPADSPSDSPAGSAPPSEQPPPASYPVVTAGMSDAVRQVAPTGGSRSASVELRAVEDDLETLLGAVRSALTEGGCVGIVRNTVGRAQEAAGLLRDSLDVEVMLVHSRMIATDRARVEASLMSRLGPDGALRPRSLVVVGTQVLEQSLDLDFDLLITDLAPIDLLLQRIGRLHRHRRGPGESDRPAPLRRPLCLITGVREWMSLPPAPDESVNWIYGAPGPGAKNRRTASSAVMRTLAALAPLPRAGRGFLDLPSDIPRLVEAVYGRGGDIPDGWEDAVLAADAASDRARQDKADRARAFLLDTAPRRASGFLGWVTGGSKDRPMDPRHADDSVEGLNQVRDSEDSVEVVVVQLSGGVIRTLPWVSLSDVAETVDPMTRGVEIPTVAEPPSELARAVARCSVTLPGSLSNLRSIEHLESNCFPGWQKSRWLAGRLPLVLDESMRAEIAGRQVEYHPYFGLRVHRNKTKGVNENGL
jgi:CRISPR-associated endonuclease/helicase Cas3